jgi:hypothetical protein
VGPAGIIVNRIRPSQPGGLAHIKRSAGLLLN